MGVLSGFRNWIHLFFIGCITGQLAFSQEVVINEFMASNAASIADEDGDYPDWIELYNAGQDTVNLDGWGISDDPANPLKWVFPAVVMQPGDYLLVWASGKNRPVQGILREVYSGISGGAVSDLINHAGFPANPTASNLVTDYFEAPANIGDSYGQRMHGCILPPASGEYTFWISGDNGSALYLDSEFQSDIPVGSGSGSWEYPLSTYYHDARTQTIYRAAEVGPANTFVGLALDVTQIPGQIMNNFTIRMKHTDLAAYDASPSWESGGWTVVYQSNQEIGLAGWVNFIFTTPFDYNGSQNLMIDLSFNNDYWTIDGLCRYSSLGGQRSLYYRTDSGYGDPLTWSGTSSPAPGVSAYAPNMKLITHYYDTPIASVPDNDWTNPRQWDKFAQQQSAPVYLEAGRFYSIMALMKEQDGNDHLCVRWQLPGGAIEEPIPAARVFAEESLALHTGFAISASGETLTLTRPNGTLADQSAPVALPRDISYGRTTDGGSAWGFALEPTPGASNNASTWYSEVLDEPQVSHPGGFFTASFELTFSTDDPEAVIYYTLDGSEPDPADLGGTTYLYKNWYPRNSGELPSSTYLSRQMQTHPYSAPLQISDRSAEIYQIAQINTQFSHSTRLPSSNIFKGTIVRARAFKDNAIPSRTVTNTYFVNSGMKTRYALPVISIVTDEDNLFEYTKGIYAAGKVADDWRVANRYVSWNEGMPANYNQRGIEWERPAHFEMYSSGGTPMLAQDIGARIHGGWSRGWFPKSIRLYARSEYDTEDAFEYPFFKGLEKRGEPGTPLTTFRRLIIRNSGNDYDQSYYRDALMQELVKHLPIDTMAYLPAVHFINGEYWGLINLRERYDDDYLQMHYGMDREDAVILTGGTAEVNTGLANDRTHFMDTVTYALNNDPSQAVHYEWLQHRVDTDNLAVYYAVQVYYNNQDWPHNNIDCWRKRTDAYEPDAPRGQDGRWRWLLYDTDFGFGLYGDYTTDSLGRVLYNDLSYHNILFIQLIRNADFRSTFINALADNINTSFKPARVTAMIDAMEAKIQSSRSEHNSRWQAGTGSRGEMKTFASLRPAVMRSHILAHFGLSGTYNLTVSRNDDWGHVQVNSAVVDEQTPGVNTAAPYPWTGQYYISVPVTLRALPRHAFRFSHWEGVPDGVDPFSDTVTLTLTEDLSLTAVFEAPPLMHYWSFNNTASLLTPTYTLGGAVIAFQSGPGTAVLADTGQDFDGTNGRLGEAIGSHFRINNPLGSTLTLNMPTTGYEQVMVMTETRRSGQGAGEQIISYSTDGQDFTPFETIAVYDDVPVLHKFDFSGVAGVDNNPNFAFRISFAQADGGVEGNNRFDNISMDAIPLPGTNRPPRLITVLPFKQGVENTPIPIDLTSFFSDPEGQTMIFTAWADKPFVVEPSVLDTTLTLSPLYRGDATITVQADDGHNTPVRSSFRVLIYPEGHGLSDGPFEFGSWSPSQPENVFPQHILFLQSDVSDPDLSVSLLYPYFIPHDGDDGYHADDLDIIGFPYMTTGRSRLNGLNEDGISFINTGRQRDLGGALIALDTTAVEAVDLSWLCQTLLQNTRQYGIRLQYRIGPAGSFANITDGGNPVEYLSGATGHTQTFGPIRLPTALMGRSNLQLLWRYYYVDGTSGTRAQIRMDDIDVTVPVFPYGGQPRDIPGLIQAEAFDVGGQDRTYYDTTAGNSGGQYRSNVNVDIASITDGTAGYAVTDIQDGEWLLYTVNSTADQKDVYARVASTQGGGQILVWLEDVLMAVLTVPNTGSLTTWQTISASCLPLPDCQEAALKLEFVGTGFQLNWIAFQSQAPYLGYSSILPGRIQFEDFDIGGQNISYYDTTASNIYEQYRPNEDVDIMSITGGYGVYMSANDWMEYTCTHGAGLYTMVVRHTSNQLAQTLTLSDESGTLATVTLPKTGGWSNWQDTSVSDVYLAGGQDQVLRFTLTASIGLLDYVDFIRQGNPADITQSGHVDLEDFRVLSSQWLDVPSSPSADIAPTGGDGTVDMLDLIILAENWLSSE